MRRALALVAAVATLWIAAPGLATTVRAVTVGEMLVASKLVFEGRVIGSRVETRDAGEYPWTCVRFEVIDTIQGSAPANPFELCFLGGRVGTRTLAVGEMHYPREGEHGIYFVADPAADHSNPLVGWSQGHFLVVTDPAHPDGVVHTIRGERVSGIQGGVRRKVGISSGVARGLEIDTTAPGLSPVTFKRKLGELRRESTR